MSREARPRLQVELTGRHRKLLARLRHLGGNDSDAARKAIEIVESAADHIQHGYKLVAVPVEDEHPDAMPELTRAVRPELDYHYLVARPHPWRKQLFFKGRRLTVGQVLGTMRREGWSAEQAAEQYELPREAVLEAMDYGDRFADLISAEDAEDARAVKALGAPASR